MHNVLLLLLLLFTTIINTIIYLLLFYFYRRYQMKNVRLKILFQNYCIFIGFVSSLHLFQEHTDHHTQHILFHGQAIKKMAAMALCTQKSGHLKIQELTRTLRTAKMVVIATDWSGTSATNQIKMVHCGCSKKHS